MTSKQPFHEKIEEYVLIVFFGVMVAVTGITVFSRYLFAFTFSWAEQLSRVCFVWISFAGISLAAARSMHLRVTALTLLFSKKIADILLVFGDIVAAIFGFFISYKMIGLIMIIASSNQTFPSMTWLPVWFMYLPGFLGMLGFSIRLLQKSIIPYFKGSKKDDENNEDNPIAIG